MQTKFPFPEDAINRLYTDYRSASYNTERIHYEPEYEKIASLVGEHVENGRGRLEALTAWVQPKLSETSLTMLDFGGADGKYLPALPAQKFVYEVSNIVPADGVTRIADRELLTSYGYVQLAHVLEHVPDPLDLARQVAALVKPGGYFLIEVPQDIDLDRLRKLQRGELEGSISIHEHINLYSAQAVEHLFTAIGFEIIAVDAIPIVSPITKQFFIRGLGKKPTGWSNELISE